MQKLIITTLSCGLLATSVAAARQKQPNIIMFLVDDMGWQDTSVPFHNNEQTTLNRRFHTPNMERMAEMGVKFTQAYACAISSPTRCSLMSGMNASRHRVTNWTLELNQKTDSKSDVIELPEWNFNGIQPAAEDGKINNSTAITPLPQILKDIMGLPEVILERRILVRELVLLFRALRSITDRIYFLLKL